MPEILETNVKIKADASSLKKETKDSISALDKLQAKYKEVSNDLSHAFASKAKGSVIQDLSNQRNEILRTINSIKAGDIESEVAKVREYTNQFAHTEGISKLGSSVAETTEEAGKMTESFAKFGVTATKSIADARYELEYLLQGVRNGAKLSEKSMSRLKELQGIVEGSNNNKSVQGISSLLGGIKKVAFAMIGIRTIFTAISKSMNTYLSQNDELRAKIDGIYYALGSALAPILEWVVNLVSTLLAYLNAFLQGLGLAGIRMKGISKGAKETQKALAGFDEINNLNSNESGGGGGINPLEGVEVNKAILEFIKDKAKEILAIVMGIVTAITLIRLGIDTLTATGIGVVIAGIVSLVQDLIDYINDPSWVNFTKILLDIGVIIAGLAIAFGVVTGGWAIALAALSALLILFKDDISKILVNLGEGIVTWFQETRDKVRDKFNAVITSGKELMRALKEAIMESGFNLKNDLIQLVTNIKTGLTQLGQQLKNELSRTGEQIKTLVTNVINTLRTGISNGLNNINSIINSILNNIKNAFSNIFNGIWNVVRGVMNKIIGGVEAMVNSCIDGINSLTRGLRNLGNSVLKAIGISGFSFSSMSTISLPRLATGTNYVPQDMIAQLHQGEAIVPKKFNEEQYINSVETNNLLRELISVVDSKEFKAYISNKEIGKTAVNYINQQSRIMGGALV